jgi:hypothetical protein
VKGLFAVSTKRNQQFAGVGQLLVTVFLLIMCHISMLLYTSCIFKIPSSQIMYIKTVGAGRLWLLPVILATWETEIGRIVV